MATNEEILAAVDAGLLAALSEQEYQLPDGTRVRRADVASLLKARGEVQAQAAAETDGCVMFQGPLGFGRPS